MEIYSSKAVDYDYSVVRRPEPQDLAVFQAAPTLNTVSIGNDSLQTPHSVDASGYSLGGTDQFANTLLNDQRDAIANDLEKLAPTTALNTASTGGTNDTGNLPTATNLSDDVMAIMRRTMQQIATGSTSVDYQMNFMSPPDKKTMARAVLASQGIDNPTEHNLEVAVNAMESGQSPSQVADAVRHDPIVFDLNHDGNTDATSEQHGLDVDGAKDTAWAAKGDGVLSMNGKPIGTVASDGTKHANAYEVLKHEAQLAGIDVSKGYLNAGDIKTLESKGLQMLVSKGDGTNDTKSLTDLGITQMSLGGTSTAGKMDSTGKNSIDVQGSFVQNGQTQAANDMGFAEVPKK